MFVKPRFHELSIFTLNVLGILLAACSSATPAPIPTPAPVPTPTMDASVSEESSVYAAGLHSIYPAGMYVVMDTTDMGNHRADIMSRLDCGGNCLQNTLPGIADETVGSFRVRNEAVYPIHADMDLGVPYVLITREELQAFPDGESFYRRYPMAIGTITLSRVGFDPAFDQALVYIDFEIDGLYMEASFVFLKKVNGVWNVDSKFFVAIT